MNQRDSLILTKIKNLRYCVDHVANLVVAFQGRTICAAPLQADETFLFSDFKPIGVYIKDNQQINKYRALLNP